MASAFELMTHEEIDQMTPAAVMLTAMRGLVKAKLIQPAISIAKEAAPYFDAKLAPKDLKDAADKAEILIRGGLPDDN